MKLTNLSEARYSTTGQVISEAYALYEGSVPKSPFISIGRHGWLSRSKRPMPSATFPTKAEAREYGKRIVDEAVKRAKDDATDVDDVIDKDEAEEWNEKLRRNANAVHDVVKNSKVAKISIVLEQ